MRQNFNPAFLIYFLVFSGPLLALSGNLITIVFFAITAIIIYYIKYPPKDILKILYKDEIMWTFLIFLLWVLIVSYRSLDPHRSINTVIKVAFLFFIGFYTITLLSLHKFQFIHLNKKYILWALIAVNLLIMGECLSHHHLNSFLRKLMHFKLEKMREPGEKATALFTILLPVFYTYLYEKSWSYLFLLVVTVLNYLTHNMFASLVAAIVVSLIMPLSLVLHKKLIKLIMFGIILLLIYTPIIFTLILHCEYIKLNIIPNLPINWLERINMWENALILIQERPFLGWGINASDALNKLVPQERNIIQLHPHNAFIQFWLETGVVGVTIISVFLYQLYLRLYAMLNSSVEIAVYMGCIGAIFTFTMLSFGIWQTWWLITFWLAVIINYVLLLSIAQTKLIKKTSLI